MLISAFKNIVLLKNIWRLFFMEIKIEQNLIFGKTDKEYLTADVYHPGEGENLPAVILIHGGGYRSGSKEMYSEWGRYLAENGFVTLAINYRLATPSYPGWPGVAEDVKSAINWLVSKSNEWNVNPLKIGLIGDSAGAHLALHCTLENPTNSSFKIQVAIGVYGIYDFEQRWKDSKEKKYTSETLFGESYPEAQEKYREASPTNLTEEAAANAVFDTSFFIIWGEQDKVVLPSQSEKMVEKLEQAGINTRTLSIPAKGHFWFNIIPGVEGGTLADYPNTEVAPQIIDFLKEKLCIEEVGNFSMKTINKLQD